MARLLDMRAAIHFDSGTTSFGAGKRYSDAFSNPFEPLARLRFERVKTIISDLTLDEEPSEEFDYQNVSPALLGAVCE